MNRSPLLFIALAGTAMVATLVGCSGAVPPTASPYTPVVTSTTLPPPPSPTGSVRGIDSRISAGDPGPIKPGGDPFEFTVTLTNTTPADLSDVGLVVALGHCTCNPSPGFSIMPPGSMKLFDPAANTWAEVPYDREATGMDFLYQNLVPPFVLEAGQTLTYRLQMRVDPNPDLIAGGSRINVIVKTPAESGQGGSLPIAIQP